MLANKRLSSYLPLLILTLIVISSFIINYIGLSNYKAPPGSDYGNYLTQVDILRGNDLRGWGLRHNPVFFILLDGFLRIFEEFTALKILSSLVFAVIAVPFFFLIKKLSGDNTSALISTWLFVFFISNSEMISWGGNPNFLGFSFMLVSLYFFVDLMNEPSKKNLLLSGFFFSLVIGSHILVAIYLLFSIFIFFITTVWSDKGINKVRFKNLALLTLVTLIFSLPYVPFYLNFFNNSSNEMAELTLLSAQMPTLSLESLGALESYWPFFVLVVVVLMAVFALSNYTKNEFKNNGILLSCLFLSPLFLSLITEHSIRWFYFIAIPLILCFGIYLKDLFLDLRNLVLGTKNSRKNIQLMAICFLAIIGFYTTFFTVLHLRSATNSYQFIENHEIEAFEWIKANTLKESIFATSGHPKGTIGGGGNSYAWWIEGYCKRVCAFSGNLKYYSYQKERDEIRLVNRIFAGTYSADYQNIRLTESYPSDHTNPEIAAYVNNDYEDILTLNDAQHQLFFSSNENDWNIDPFYSENSTSNITNSDTWTVTYNRPHFDLTRNILLGEDNSSVDLIFQILPKNSTLNLFTVNLYALFETSLEECDINEDYLVSLSKVMDNEIVKSKIRVLETNGKLGGAKVLFENIKKSRPIVSYSFEPLEDDLYIHMRINVESSDEEPEYKQSLQFYNSYQLIEDLNVDYIFLNRYQENEFDRFLADTEHFVEEFQNDIVVIFRVY